MISALAAVVVALYPGLYTWWRSRKLVDLRDDPLLPDLLLSRSRSATRSLAVAFGVGLVLAAPYLGLILAAAILGVAIGAFPSRRRIFDETWSLGAYLSHRARFYLGNFGALLLLAFLPQVSSAAGRFGIAAGLAAGAAVVGYGAVASRVFPALLRAKPLDRPGLVAPFERILAAARTRRPRVYEADAPGGAWFNAFALPSVRRPAVVFTRGLLDALAPDETAAIFAHEVAHLEHYHPRRLWRSRLVLLAIVVLVVAGWAGPWSPALRGYEWVFTVAIGLAVAGRVGHAARHESESDRRAVELCGDPEALVRGLTKLHTLARVPRRFSERTEKHATHPSLARRIQSIRAAAKTERDFELEIEPVFVLASDGSGRGVRLDSERLHALAGVPEGSSDPLSEAAERRSFAYGELRELRVEATTTARALVFREASGATTRIPIATTEASRLQEVLDAVDDRLGYVTPPHPPVLPRVASLLVMLLSLLAQAFAVVPLAALALFAPAAATLAALGISGLLSALLGVLRPQAALFSPTPLLYVLLGLGSAACVALAIRGRREPAARVPAALAFLLPLGVAGLSLPGLLPLPASTLPFMYAHLWARSHPAVPIGLVGAAAALLTLRRAKARAGSVAALAAAGAVLALGSLPARELLSSDVFRDPGATLAVVPVALETKRALDVPGAVIGVALSPRGERFAVSTYRPGRMDADELTELDVYVERREGAPARFSALGLTWWDEQRLLLVALGDEVPVLRLVHPDTGVAEEEIALPPLVEVELVAEPASHRWLVTGRDPQERDLVAVWGELGADEEVEILRFGYDEDTGSSPEVVSPNGVGLATDFEVPALQSPIAAWSWAYPDTYRYIVRRLSLRRPESSPRSVGLTMLEVDCPQTAPSALRFVCVVSEEGRTSAWTLDPGTGQWARVGAWEGRLYAGPTSGEDRLVLLGGVEGPVLVDLAAKRALAPKLSRLESSVSSSALARVLYGWEGFAPPSAAAWRGGSLAVASPWDPRTETSRVTLYELR